MIFSETRSGKRRFRHFILLSLLLIFWIWIPATEVHAEEAIIVNPDVTVSYLSQNALRAIFGMRLRAWPDKRSIRVFVLRDNDPAHIRFTKEKLSIFPHQLRWAWDRLVYSGTGQAPTEVDSEREMLNAVASTPGSIGYVDADMANDSVRVVEVR